MPVFYQKEINPTTKLAAWKIEEPESFFKSVAVSHREVAHPHKRLQHLTGRFLLRYLSPNFPVQQIRIADTRKPFLVDNTYRFSISHCGNFVAAMVSCNHRVGIDIEIPSQRIVGIKPKFISEDEDRLIQADTAETITQAWSVKEAVYKWYGMGPLDFKKHMQLKQRSADGQLYQCFFTKDERILTIDCIQFAELCLSYICTNQ